MPSSAAKPSKETARSSRDSRQRLLEIAGEVFAERGFDAATVKEITDRAGINVASVNYYFRDKFSLYLEVLRYSMASRRFMLEAPAGLSAEERLAFYVSGFMKTLVADGRPGWYSRIMVRELAQPTAALPQVVEEIIRPNCQFLRDLVSEIAECDGDEEMVRLLTHSVLAQCVHYKISQPIFALLWPDLRLDAAQLERIARHIAAFSIAGIRGMARAVPVRARRRQTKPVKKK